MIEVCLMYVLHLSEGNGKWSDVDFVGPSCGIRADTVWPINNNVLQETESSAWTVAVRG